MIWTVSVHLFEQEGVFKRVSTKIFSTKEKADSFILKAKEASKLLGIDLEFGLQQEQID